MDIGIIDADLLDNGTRHPNIALEKISGYHKEKGNMVQLLTNYKDIKYYDKVYLSKVFNFTKIPIDLTKFNNIEYGGTGLFWNQSPKLPYEIEHHMPDYYLYDNWIAERERVIKGDFYKDYKYYSIGFLTRGCIWGCEFCVNENYKEVFRHAYLKEFYDPTRKYIYLWDDNVFAYDKWYEVFDELFQSNRYFQFRQGLDIRLLTERKAKVLSESKWKGDYIFAFDDYKNKILILDKLRLWKKYSNKTTKLYILCAFDRNKLYDLSFWINDISSTFERIKILMQFGCLSYIMRFEKYKESPFYGMYNNIGAWCNQPNFYKKMSFREFCFERGKLKDSNEGASWRYLYDFERKYPEIAKQYFDMRYENLNLYN